MIPVLKDNDAVDSLRENVYEPRPGKTPGCDGGSSSAMNQGSLPTISIVTPCLNAEEYIKEAVESVLAQHYPCFQHIVVDGASTDRTLEILSRYDHLKVISEPDQGLYDALNKGLARAEGDLIGWLNADDLYADHAFWTVVKAFRNKPSADLVCGLAQIFAREAGFDKVIARHQFSGPSAFSRRQTDHIAVLLNASFLTHALYQRVGEFDTRYRIASDKDYLIRLALTRPNTVTIGDLIYRYRQHHASITFRPFRDDTTAEQMAIENLQLCSECLRRRSLPPEIRRYCRHTYRAYAVSLLRLYLRRGDRTSGMRILGDLIRREPLTVLRYGTKHIATRLASLLRLSRTSDNAG